LLWNVGWENVYGSEKRFQQKLLRKTVLCVRYAFHFSLSFWGQTCNSDAPELLHCSHICCGASCFITFLFHRPCPSSILMYDRAASLCSSL